MVQISNRYRLIDSKVLLDSCALFARLCPMAAQLYQIYVERRKANRNMARFYALAISPTLFGEVQLTRRWGRIGSRGQAMTHTFEREDDAVHLLLDLLRHKRKRGYGPRGRAAELISRG
jgi:predicted DNA-binding WGR domain protein